MIYNGHANSVIKQSTGHRSVQTNDTLHLTSSDIHTDLDHIIRSVSAAPTAQAFLAARRQRSSHQQFVDSLSPEFASFIFDSTSLWHILCACDFVVAAICIQLTQTSNQPGSFASVLWSSQLTSISLRVEHNGHLPHHTTISARSMKHMLAQLLHIVRGQVHSAVNYTSNSS